MELRLVCSVRRQCIIGITDDNITRVASPGRGRQIDALPHVSNLLFLYMSPMFLRLVSQVKNSTMFCTIVIKQHFLTNVFHDSCLPAAATDVLKQSFSIPLAELAQKCHYFILNH